MRKIYGIILLLCNLGRADAQDIFELPPVVITATRTAQTIEQSLAPVTILDTEQLNSVNTLPEALRNVPGVNITNSGGWGKLTNLNLRGTNSSHVLLLVDGIPLSSVTAGIPAFEYLPLSQIKRIEVVRGPQSGLYGSAAIGGIIQILTPKITRPGPTKMNLSMRAGSLNTYDTHADFSGATDTTNFYLGATNFITAGHDIGNANQSDADGYRNRSLGLRLGQRWGNTTVDFHLLRASGNNQFDNDFIGGADYNDFLQQVAGIDLNFSPRTNWQSRLTLGEARDELDYPTTSSYYHTHRIYRSWQNNLILNRNNLLTLGIDQQKDQITANDVYTQSSRTNQGFFLQHQSLFGIHHLLAGIRYDDNQSFAGHTTGNINYGIRLTPAMQLITSWGSAFKAPNFNDLYLTIPGFYQGNPNLQPETAHSTEIALVATPKWGSWEIRAFRTAIHNLITPTADYSTMINLQQARINGIEIGSKMRLANWEISAALNFLEPRNRTTDQILPGRTRHTAQLNLARKFGAFHSVITVLNQGQRHYPDQNLSLSGYTLFGINLDYSLNPRWKIEASIDNLGDKDYQTVAGYNSLGRIIMMGIRYTDF